MLIGSGSPEAKLSTQAVYQYCAEAFSQINLAGKKVLAVIPDQTRTAPIDLLFRTVCQLLNEQVAQLDFMIALGTHPPMAQAAIYERVGLTVTEHRQKFSRVRFFNHDWHNPQELAEIGTISDSEMAHLSQGLLNEKVTITLNKKALEYDLLLLIGPTYPHEVVGFSGGNKYLFPGIAGQAIIDVFHWLGALITNRAIIGKKETAVRQVIDRAAAMVPVARLGINLVVKGPDLMGLYIGEPETAWRAAADLSARVHVVYTERTYPTVLSCAPAMYTDLWTGGKCMYKLEPVVADGGELIIFAPHIREVSVTHGTMLTQIGYHVRDYFLRQWDKFSHFPGGVLAHSTHVKGAGSFANGIEYPRIRVTLATGIPRETCQQINLGYRDPQSITIEEWRRRPDTLVVAKAGEILYKPSFEIDQ